VFRGPDSLGISISRRTHATRKSCASELKAVCLEKEYEHHRFNCSDPAVDRRAANLAVQRRLGLLSDRRPRPAGSDRVDSRLVETHLARHELVFGPATAHARQHKGRVQCLRPEADFFRAGVDLPVTQGEPARAIFHHQK
jgi:hypothetical protein